MKLSFVNFRDWYEYLIDNHLWFYVLMHFVAAIPLIIAVILWFIMRLLLNVIAVLVSVFEVIALEGFDFFFSVSGIRSFVTSGD